MKSLPFPIIMVLIIGSLSVAMISVQVPSALGTTVGGTLLQDTTWTKENSPYIIDLTVHIPSNVTLTIEPGVTVTAGNNPGDMFSLAGQIYAHGTANEKIIFEGGGTQNFFVDAGNSSETYLDLDYVVIRDGGCFWPSGELDAHGHFSLTYSLLTNLTTGSDIRYPYDDVHIEYNTFVHCAGFSIGHGGDGDGQVYVRHNLFKDNVGAVIDEWAAANGPTVIDRNSFIDMHGIVINTSVNDTTARNNYWGTTNTSIIGSMIYDRNDDIARPDFVQFLPILTEPNPSTPTLPVSASFTYYPSTAYANASVVFDASASFGTYSAIENYTWNFGDGNITTLNRPTVSHVYSTLGNYSVALKATDNFGYADSKAISLRVLQDNSPPVTTDSYDGAWHSSDFIVNLTATDQGSGVSGTYYRINGAQTQNIGSSGQPMITLEGANNTLEYWSVDRSGNEELPHKIMTGIKLDKTPPIAVAGETREANANEAVAFDAGSSTDNAGIASYRWDFGDGTTETSIKANHSYAKSGVYSITLTVTDYAYLTDTVTSSLTVSPDNTLIIALVAICALLGATVAAVWFVRRSRRTDLTSL
jgi:PKD repeat protein